MNRRGFLGSLLAAAVAPAIVRADSLMRIVPTETTILSALEQFVVTSVGSGNTLLTMEEITRQALRIAHEKMVFIGHLSHPHHGLKVGDVVTIGGAHKPGDTIRIRVPELYKRVGA